MEEYVPFTSGVEVEYFAHEFSFDMGELKPSDVIRAVQNGADLKPLL